MNWDSIKWLDVNSNSFEATLRNLNPNFDIETTRIPIAENETTEEEPRISTVDEYRNRIWKSYWFF